MSGDDESRVVHRCRTMFARRPRTNVVVGDTGIEPVTPTVSMLSRTSWLVPLTLEPLVSDTSDVGWHGWRRSVSVAAWPPRGPGERRRSRASRLREATPWLARRLSGSVPDARSPQCDPLPRNDVILHRQAVRPGGDVDPAIRPMKAPGCATATHGRPLCRKDTDPRPESAHVPAEARLPALATRRSVRSIGVVISDRVPRTGVVRASARCAIPCRTRDVERHFNCC
jgi:hypothetical protein